MLWSCGLIRSVPLALWQKIFLFGHPEATLLALMIFSRLFQPSMREIPEPKDSMREIPELKDLKNWLKNLQVNGEQAGGISKDIFF